MTTELTKAAQQALEVLESLQGGCTDHDDGTVEAITVWCPEVIEALRNALTQRPQAVPMTLAEVAEAHVKAPYTSNDSFYSIFSCGIRAAEAHHRIGITAPAGGEKQA